MEKAKKKSWKTALKAVLIAVLKAVLKAALNAALIAAFWMVFSFVLYVCMIAYMDGGVGHRRIQSTTLPSKMILQLEKTQDVANNYSTVFIGNHK